MLEADDHGRRGQLFGAPNKIAEKDRYDHKLLTKF